MAKVYIVTFLTDDDSRRPIKVYRPSDDKKEASKMAPRRIGFPVKVCKSSGRAKEIKDGVLRVL